MTVEDVKNSTYCGERVGDLSQEKLYEVIAAVGDDYEREKESHDRTLNMLRLSAGRKRQGE